MSVSKEEICELEVTAKIEAMKQVGIFMTSDREGAVRAGVHRELSEEPKKMEALCIIFMDGAINSNCNPKGIFLKRRTNTYEKVMTPKQLQPVVSSKLPDSVLRDIYSNGHRTYGN